MTTIQEKRLNDLRSQLDRNIDLRDGTLDRLMKLCAKVKELTKAVERAEKRVTKYREAAVPNEGVPIPDAIPAFLRRDPTREFNPYEAQHKEAKAIKTRARIEKLKAKQRGDLAKMPLTGRAALEAIRKGVS